MNTKKKEQDMKSRWITRLTILAAVVGLIVIAWLIANSNFNLVDYLIKLHGG